MKKVYGAFSAKNIFLCVLLICTYLTDAFPSDPKAIAEKYGLDIHTLKPVEFRIGTLAPSDTPWVRFPLDHIIQKIKKDTEGHIILRIYAGGTMGDDSDIIAKMKLGQLHGCGCSAQGMYEAVPELSVLSLPLLFRNYDEVDDILNKFRKDIDMMFQRRGYRLFSILDSGFLYLFTKNKVVPITEIRKQILGTWFGKIEGMLIDELGGRHIPVQVPEKSMSLKNGLVDGSFSPSGWELATQAFLYTKYVVDTPFFYSPAALMIDEKYLKELEKRYPPGLFQEISEYILDLVGRSEKDWRAEIRDFEKKCLYAYINSGRTSISLTSADVDTLNAAAQNVKKKLAGSMRSQDFLSKVESELTRFRKETIESKKP